MEKICNKNMGVWHSFEKLHCNYAFSLKRLVFDTRCYNNRQPDGHLGRAIC